MLELILAGVRTGRASAADPPGSAESRLHGPTLLLARAVWLTSFGAILLIFAVSIPAYWAYLHTIRSSGVDIYAGQLTPGELPGLPALGLSLDGYAAYLVSLKVLFGGVWLVIGAVLFWRKSDDRMALFASFTLVTFSVSFGYWAEAALPAWALLLHYVNFVSGVSISLFLVVFADGRFVPHWTRWPFIMISVFHGVYSTFLTAPLAASPLLSALDGLSFPTILIGVVAVQVYRYRRVSTPAQRQQTKWAVFGIALAMVGFVIVIVLNALFPASYMPGTLYYLGVSTLLYVALLCVPLFIGLAILRAHLWDIDLVINRTLVYGTLTTSIVGLYLLVVGYLEALFRSSGNLVISLVATGLVAVLFQPLRQLLQRGANRLLYGQRDEPYTVVTRLSQRLEATLAPDAVLSTIVETVAQALKLPYAAILLTREDTFILAASYGQPGPDLLRLPLVYQAETVGQLCLASRTPGEPFSGADRQLFAELARHAGLAAHAVRLTVDLQRSRAHLVTTREEERRRLRRDLHDGLGSTLTGVVFKLDATETLLDQDPLRARAVLAEARAQTQATINDIRRLVYNLRPPILDEWGLLAALREQVAQYELNNVQVAFVAPESLPPLSAAVEVAAYRIVLEALTNVIKHAQATACTIRLGLLAEALTIEVEDNGVGRAHGAAAGVGLTTMGERASELGGSCSLEEAAPHGTRVLARLPLAKE